MENNGSLDPGWHIWNHQQSAINVFGEPTHQLPPSTNSEAPRCPSTVCEWWKRGVGRKRDWAPPPDSSDAQDSLGVSVGGAKNVSYMFMLFLYTCVFIYIYIYMLIYVYKLSICTKCLDPRICLVFYYKFDKLLTGGGSYLETSPCQRMGEDLLQTSRSRCLFPTAASFFANHIIYCISTCYVFPSIFGCILYIHKNNM